MISVHMTQEIVVAGMGEAVGIESDAQAIVSEHAPGHGHLRDFEKVQALGLTEDLL